MKDSQERNVRLIRTWYYKMWNLWDKTVFGEILTPDFSIRGSLGSEWRGYNGLSDYMDFVRSAFPDFTNSIEETISEADKAFARLTYTGTHQGEIFGVASTGRRFSYAGAAVFYFDRKRISKVWVLGDVHALLDQLKA